jgi:predicted Ser/Thr protein kinase
VLGFKEIVLHEQLGAGSYGVVYKGEWRNQKVAGIFLEKSRKIYFYSEKNECDLQTILSDF